jgi:hypothetical protein
LDITVLKEFAGVLTAFAAVLAGIVGLLKYFQYRTRRDKISLVGEAFDAVVDSLASDAEVERLAGAILLRRFFDPKTELGIAGTPYAEEAVRVIAAILRSQESGNFQKLLADGLAYAPSLESADLQRTNLQNAYLGSRRVGGDRDGKITTIDLSYSDFYRADLSGASLKGAKARGAVFYQARMHNTILSRANLQSANFFGADLKGAKFDGALLNGATFKDARNTPPALASQLDEVGVYPHTQPFQPPPTSSVVTWIRVFISKPGTLDYQQQQLVASILSRLEAEGLTPQTLERPDYPRFGLLGEVRRIMSDCAGAIIFGFRQLEVHDGLWQHDASDKDESVKSVYFSTPWNQIEAGMAAMLGLPIFVACQHGVVGGVFDVESGDYQIYRVFLDGDQNSNAFLSSFADWCAAVHERSQAS